MTTSTFGDLDGTPIKSAAIKLSGQGTITRRLGDDEPVAFIVYGHAGLPLIKSVEEELVRIHPLKATYIAELTPALVKAIAGKRTTHTILDAVREAYDGTQGIARLPMPADDDAALELEEELAAGEAEEDLEEPDADG